jgi:hypothetical protein
VGQWDRAEVQWSRRSPVRFRWRRTKLVRQKSIGKREEEKGETAPKVASYSRGGGGGITWAQG